MAVEQKDKVRLVLDMSRPEGRSFNDNLTVHKLVKVNMSTARQFSFTVKEAGRHALMSKFDMRDAYKLVPARKQDWRLQGMAWLGKFFVETQMIFGACSSVAIYDTLSSTVLDLAISASGIPRRWVFRTLDDVPTVTPAGSGWALVFSQTYQDICAQLDIPLAQPCPKRDKAFSCQTSGKVLGTWFDTSTMSWAYPEDKLVPLVRSMLEMAGLGTATLHEMQSMMGCINDVAQLCPFLKGIRKPLLSFQASFGDKEDLRLPIPASAQADLLTCCKIICSAGEGLPIAARPGAPPLNAIRFTSDAAGAIMVRQDGQSVAFQSGWAIGAASISMDEDDNPWFACRVTWPPSFINKARDSKGCLFGSKSTCLEAIGALLPLLAIPSQLAGRHVILELDNMAVLYGWEKRQAQEDMEASIFIRAIHYISCFLACQVHIEHLPRRSSRAAIMADDLSREETTSSTLEHRIRALESPVRSGALSAWLANPEEDWDLAASLLKEVERKCPSLV